MRLVLVDESGEEATVAEVARAGGHELVVARDLEHATSLCRGGADVLLFLAAGRDAPPLETCAEAGTTLVGLVENDDVEIPRCADDFVVLPICPARLRVRLELLERRREAAAELERSERTRDALLQAIPDTMYRTNLEGRLLDYIPAHEFPLANWGVERIGDTGEEIRRRVPDLPEELLHRIREAKASATATGEVQVIEFSLASPAGPRFYETRIAVCGDDEFLGITRDITDRKLAERELRSAALIKQAFASRVLSLQESERYHVARELHDVVGQMLLVHRLDAEFIADQAATPAAMREAARALCSKVDDTLRMVRALALGLRPPALDDLGLGSALETLAREIGAKASLSIDVEVEDGVADLGGEVGVALYRVAQEAITNAVRHSGGQKISVTLRNSGESAELRVEDDGLGISAERARDSASMGLLGIRERSELLGGRATIAARAGGGTVVSATIPRSRHDEHERTHTSRHRR